MVASMLQYYSVVAMLLSVVDSSTDYRLNLDQTQNESIVAAPAAAAPTAAAPKVVTSPAKFSLRGKSNASQLFQSHVEEQKEDTARQAKPVGPAALMMAAHAVVVVDLLVLGADSKQTVAIVRESEVEGRTLSAGKHEWLTSATEAGAKARFWAADTSSQGESEHICVVAAANDGTGASVLNLDASSGKVQSKAELPKEVGKGLRRGAFQVVDGHLVVLADGKVSAYPFCGQSVGKSVEAFDLAKVKSSAVAWKLQPWQRTRGVFSATDGVSTAVFGLGSKGLKLLRTIDGVA
ncbi:unnamed protein product, partial [Polarella glacialis]